MSDVPFSITVAEAVLAGLTETAKDSAVLDAVESVALAVLELVAALKGDEIEFVDFEVEDDEGDGDIPAER